jgi:hypothetical protein
VPYLIYAIHYGSPTPETPAQIALITDGARAAGWTSLPRKSFPEYLLYFIDGFVADWMPLLGPRSALNYAMLIIPVVAIGCGFAGAAYALQRLLRGEETPRDVVVVAGAVAIGVMPLAGLSLYGAIKEQRWRAMCCWPFSSPVRSSSASSASRSVERFLFFSITERKPRRAICTRGRSAIARA